jgi:hypothetical protein
MSHSREQDLYESRHFLDKEETCEHGVPWESECLQCSLEQDWIFSQLEDSKEQNPDPTRPELDLQDRQPTL